MSAAFWLGSAGLTLVAGALVALHRNRTRVRATALGAGVILLIPGVLFFILQQSLVGYVPLHREQTAANIHFTREGPSLFAASLRWPGGPDGSFRIHGNEWQIDARILTWKAWAHRIGMRPLYRFERLSGRYADIRDEREKPRSIHALCEAPEGWWQAWVHQGTRVPGADAYYGTAAYLPMADGADYIISVSASGLVVRPDNPAAQRAIREWGALPR